MTTGPEARVVIIGAGPIGLESAWQLSAVGFETVVYERATVADNVRRWGHVELFSPFEMNSSAAGREAVGAGQPDRDALLTGAEFVGLYLEPLARAVGGRAVINERSQVVSVSRESTWKHHLVGRRDQAGDRFRLVIETEGVESYQTADVVLDCSGTWGNPNPIGAGGICCLGERRVLLACDYEIPDLRGDRRLVHSGHHTVVVGSGHSAATAVVALSELSAEQPETRVTWITSRRLARPLETTPEDPLVARTALVESANRLATEESSPVDWLPGALVLGIDGGPDAYSVAVDVAGRGRTVIVAERVLGLTGCRPDRSLYGELQVQECYATGGLISLAGESSGDCLTQSAGGIETLQSPEPDFYILGSKSYGRDSRFLLRVGLEQVELVVEHLRDKFLAGGAGRGAL